jgi:UDP-glucose 4-epimerase
MRVLITGASGFIGRELVRVLEARRAHVFQALRDQRSPPAGGPGPGAARRIGDIGPDTDWESALEGIEVVVHLAARAHVLGDRGSEGAAAYWRVNAEGTARLCADARKAGVRRLVLMSTIKVNGESTAIDRPFVEDDRPAPTDAYGRSKLAAEDSVRSSGLEWTVLRPPLVYGPGVRANFERLIRWVAAGRPLPLASVRNARSMIYLGNLVDATARAVDDAAAANQLFLVSDGRDLSTPDLVRMIASGLHRRARLVPFPTGLLRGVAAVLGRQAVIDRLAGSLRVDSSHIRRTLRWDVPYGIEHGVAATVEAWNRARQASVGMRAGCDSQS